MSYVLFNVTSGYVTINLMPFFDVEGVPNWRIRKMARSKQQSVKIAPHQTDDLCKYGYTVEELDRQVEIKGFLRKGYLRRVIDGEYVDATPYVTQAEVEKFSEDTQGIPEDTPTIDDPQQEVVVPPPPSEIPENDSPIPPETGTDRIVQIEDLHLPPVLQPEVVKDDLKCMCGFMGKNELSIKTHMRMCKVLKESSPQP